MTNGANASYISVNFAAYDLYIRVIHLMSSVKWNPRFSAVVENDMTLCPNEREVQFRFFMHLFRCMKRHSVFSSFNCNLFSIIQHLTLEIHISAEEIAPWTFWGSIQVSI